MKDDDRQRLATLAYIKKNAPFRSSLHLDGFSSSTGLLADSAELERIVRHVADLAEMRIINVTTSNIKSDLSKLQSTVFEDEGGISILALISTSHIALHTWPARRTFMFDLVSCRPFNAEDVHLYLTGALCMQISTYDMSTDPTEIQDVVMYEGIE